ESSRTPPTALRTVPPPRSGEGWRPARTPAQVSTGSFGACDHAGRHPSPERGGGTMRSMVGGDAGGITSRSKGLPGTGHLCVRASSELQPLALAEHGGAEDDEDEDHHEPQDGDRRGIAEIE